MSRSLSRMIDRVELVEQAKEVGIPPELVRRLYDQGWKDATVVAERNRLHEAEKRKTALVTANDHFQRQLDEARYAGHREGLQEGLIRSRVRTRPQEPPRPHARPSAPPPPRAPERSKVKLLEDVEAQCRIISESNPSMAPAINALRHRLKKLGR